MFSKNTVIKIAIPEKKEIHGAFDMYSLPSLNIFPQLGTGGGTPTPKKLRPASERIELAKVIESCIINAFKLFGRISFNMILKLLLPRQRTAFMYSKFLIDNTLTRTTLTHLGVYTILIAHISLYTPGPKTAIITKAKKMPGKAIIPSIILIIILSAFSKNPEINPKITPKIPTIKVDTAPTKIEILPPQITRLKISRPKESVPNIFFRLGGFNLFIILISKGE